MIELRDSQEIERLFELLLAQQKQAFPKSTDPLEVSTKQGVYIIYEGQNVLYVGKTLWLKGGLQRRLQNHLRGRSAFAKAYFSGAGHKLREKNYAFQYLEVAHPPRRAFLEALAIEKLAPQYIGVGAKK